MSKDRSVYLYAIQYKPGTDLARRFPGPGSGRFKSREEAENLRLACPNAEHMEVIQAHLKRAVETGATPGLIKCACGRSIKAQGLGPHRKFCQDAS